MTRRVTTPTVGSRTGTLWPTRSNAVAWRGSALRWVPRSRPFEAIDELGEISVPVVVVASADEPDPGHPQAVGEAYAAAIPGARLVLDEPGRSPIAWQGSQLSKLIAEVAAEADTR